MMSNQDISQDEIMVEIGKIFVDSGLIWIGDPCYYEDKKRFEGQEGYLNLLREMIDIERKSFRFKNGVEGLGVCCSTLNGDGEYPVYGIYQKGSYKPRAIIIDFDPKEEVPDVLT